jgi:hypothetical protein
VSGGPGCTFAAPSLAPGAVVRLDCTPAVAPSTVTLSAGFGAITYQTAVFLGVHCPRRAVFDGTTCVPDV